MSGGYFNYDQFKLEEIANQIDFLVEKNKTMDKYGEANNYPEDIIDRFKETSIALRRAGEMVHEIDWLVCGDTGEDSFRAQWAKKCLNEH